MSAKINENEIWLKLINTALEDGAISAEEMRLIKDIITNYESYTKLMENAIEDGYISFEEKIALFKARKNILDKAFLVANDDYKITRDEYALLETVLDIISHIEKSN